MIRTEYPVVKDKADLREALRALEADTVGMTDPRAKVAHYHIRNALKALGGI